MLKKLKKLAKTLQTSATANNPHGWQETGQSGKVSHRVGIGAGEGVAAEAPPSVRSATLFEKPVQ